MSSKVRVGIVGARFAARFHLEAYHKVYGIPVEVVGMTSKSQGKPRGICGGAWPQGIRQPG